MKRERKTLPTQRGYGPRQVEWIKSDWFCIQCGKQDVWQETDDGEDYYHGCSATCHSCQCEICCLGRVEDPAP